MKEIRKKIVDLKNRIHFTEKQRILIGVWLFLIGVLIISGNYLMSRKAEVYEKVSFELTGIPQEIEGDDGTPDEELNDSKPVINDTGEVVEEFVNRSYYVGRLEIPKIKLIRGFASMKSKENNVDKNIAIMPSSKYPDVKKGNFILAGHTGNAWNCFFRNLYKLEVGDKAYVYYNNVKYNYQLVSKYNQKKTGTARIYRNLNYTTMTLITCTRGTNNLQTLFIFKLIGEEKI